MDEKLLVLAEIVGKLRKQVKELDSSISTVSKASGPAGKDGKDGKDGKNGKDGLDGKDGKDGIDGRDGKDGKDGEKGQDGLSITDVYFAADGSLVCVLSDGTEIDAGIPLKEGASGFSAVINQWAGYSVEELKKSFIAATFETINKNLEASNATLSYNISDDLTEVNYANGITKTLAYNLAGDLTSVTLSGATPADITLVKTLGYTGSNLTSVSYA